MNKDHFAAVAIGSWRCLCRTLPILCALVALSGCGGGDNAEETATDPGAAARPGTDAVTEAPEPEGDIPDAPPTPDPVLAESSAPGAKFSPPSKDVAAPPPSPATDRPDSPAIPSAEPSDTTEKAPTVRPRVKSPIEKLPPPEKEMTPPPPRNSIAASELVRAKSEEAGATYMAFIEAETTADRLKIIRNPKGLESKVEEYHTTHEQRDFKITETQIMGSGRRLDDPTKFVFPYYVATTKNPFGFLVLVYEEQDGMKLSWEQFVLGQDYPLHEFILRKDTEPYEFLGAITQAHIFDPDFTDAEKAKLMAVNLDLPRVALPDKPIAYIDRDSEIGTTLQTALPWGKRQLCRIGLTHDAKGKLRIASYAKLAHPN